MFPSASGAAPVADARPSAESEKSPTNNAAHPAPVVVQGETSTGAAALIPAQRAVAFVPPHVSTAAAAVPPQQKRGPGRPRGGAVTTLIPEEVLLNNRHLMMPHHLPPDKKRKPGRPKGSKDTQPRKKHKRRPKELPTMSNTDKLTLEAAQKRKKRHEKAIEKSKLKVQEAEADVVEAQKKLEAARKSETRATQAAQAAAVKHADDFLVEPTPWNHAYKRLLKFKEKHNVVNLKSKISESQAKEWGDSLKEYKSLAKWELDQRTAKRRGLLQPYQLILLDRLEFNWNPLAGPGPEKWTRMYEKLKQYKQETGTCKVPNNYHDAKLALWAKTQVTQYRNGLDGKKPSLTEERIQLLEEIGFDWGVKRAVIPWETRYQELKTFRQEYGHGNVPWKWERNRPLAAWVNRQRNLYRDLNNGIKAPAMTEERIRLLEEVGLQWSTHGKGRYNNDPAATQQEAQQEAYYSHQAV